jgi:hypothetical protein
VAWFWVCVVQAWAHPFGAQAVAHDLVVEIEPQEVKASWRIDVPTPIILQDMNRSRQSSFERVWAEVGGTVQVLKDGQRTTGEVRSGEPTPSDATSWVFPVTVTAHTGSEGEVDWVFSNGTFTDLRGFHRFELRIDARLEVLDSSLLMRDSTGEFAWDASGRWREGEGYREVSVRVAPRRWLDQVWRQHVLRVSDQGGLLEGARRTPGQVWLTTPRLSWLPGVCIWIWVSLLSTVQMTARKGRVGFRMFCVGSLMGLLALGGDHGPMAQAVMAMLGVCGWMLGRDPNLRLGGRMLLLASVGVTLGTWVGCGVALGCVGLGSSSRQQPPRWLQVALAGCGVVWLVLRWLATR